ncbi:sterol regulatory element-binding protein cleavage-activating protein-like [Leptidea sinapis]|uniref:sterol regulatory element-binding protein cleavage-activating protein-like n=1 Tax=Leptidea sinapis TaxID=189913 RepID=UPI0021264060|nr:sterol regulatory element-binding protein cleavage-activating protein-like [Leptidea sinapis]
MTGSTLPERVAQIYYTYGLFCSSHPITAITLALSVVLLCCYPLLNVPLPGNIPTVVKVPVYQNDLECVPNTCLDQTGSVVKFDYLHNETQKLPYTWAKEKPLLYVHQIVMRIGVSPWNENLKMWDAYRGPLLEVFRLLEAIRNHEDPETKKTLVNCCYQIEGLRKSSSTASLDRVLPEYSCLLLSPANLWQQSLQTFSLDANMLNTIFNYHSIHKGKTSIAEMAFGMQLRDTGIKRYPLRARPRVLQYAVTVFYQQAEQSFIDSLASKLREMYPLFGHAREHVVGEATLVHYPGRCNYRELVPLLISFVGLFLYVYFSVRKITFIKSKLGLAACSVVTIAAGLSMSMGICFYFGFSLSLQGKEIFPYLVIIVALENILVLTKSVTSTDSRLDVKIRLAQGLSKEGWSITKNLLTEITILTVSLFTFVPFIQEFSIYMIVSLISDYFVQMFFFATVLGIDVSRMEYYSEQKNKLHLKEYFAANNALNWNHVGFEDGDQSSQRMTKSKSHPRLNGLTSKPSDVVANSGSAHQSPKRVPKRIRLVNMWARTRFFQRAFMVWMLVWISMIVYNSGVVEYFLTGAERAERPRAAAGAARGPVSSPPRPPPPPPPPPPPADHAAHDNTTLLLKHPLHARPTSRLSAGHWAAVLSQYNASLAGRHLVVLPAVLLSHRVSPDAAAAARLPRQRDPPPLRWQALAAALDPIDLLPELDLIDSKNQQQWSKGAELPMYPSTPMEVLLLTILCSISVAVIAYMMVVLYRCICSRHYAEWRASWTEEDEYRKIIAKQPAVQLVMEAVPLVVGGHSQEVECLVTDGEKIVSTCLQGSVHVWDSLNGDLITNIDRRAYFKFQSELLDRFKSRRSVDRDPPPGAATTQRLQEPDFVKLQRPEVRLRKGALNNHLSQLRRHSSSRYRAPAGLSAAETTKYSFAKTFRELYISDEQSVNEVKQVTANSGDGHTNRCAEGGEADWRARPFGDSPVWCADFCNDLIVLGCADGRLEFWEATSSKLKVSRLSPC